MKFSGIMKKGMFYTYKLNPRKHVMCVTETDGIGQQAFLFIQIELVPINLLHLYSDRKIRKIYKDLALVSKKIMVTREMAELMAFFSYSTFEDE